MQLGLLNHHDAGMDHPQKPPGRLQARWPWIVPNRLLLIFITRQLLFPPGK